MRVRIVVMRASFLLCAPGRMSYNVAYTTFLKALKA